MNLSSEIYISLAMLLSMVHDSSADRRRRSKRTHANEQQLECHKLIAADKAHPLHAIANYFSFTPDTLPLQPHATTQGELVPGVRSDCANGRVDTRHDSQTRLSVCAHELSDSYNPARIPAWTREVICSCSSPFNSAFDNRLSGGHIKCLAQYFEQTVFVFDRKCETYTEEKIRLSLSCQATHEFVREETLEVEIVPIPTLEVPT